MLSSEGPHSAERKFTNSTKENAKSCAWEEQPHALVRVKSRTARKQHYRKWPGYPGEHHNGLELVRCSCRENSKDIVFWVSGYCLQVMNDLSPLLSSIEIVWFWEVKVSVLSSVSLCRRWTVGEFWQYIKMHYWKNKEKGDTSCWYPVKEQEKIGCHMLKYYQFKTITVVCDPYELLLYAFKFSNRKHRLQAKEWWSNLSDNSAE